MPNERNRIIDEIIEKIRPYGAGLFTGWEKNDPRLLGSYVALDDAEDHFELAFLDIIDVIKEMKTTETVLASSLLKCDCANPTCVATPIFSCAKCGGSVA